MSAATIETTKPMRTPSRQLRRPRRGRPSRGSGRRGAPIGRSAAGVAAPSLRHGALDRYLSDDCQSQTATLGAPTVGVRVNAAASSGWRLTDRGIAVVLITGAVLLAAAVTVITATAITVTSSDYVQPGYSAIGGR